MRHFYAAFLTTGFCLIVLIGCGSPTQTAGKSQTADTADSVISDSVSQNDATHDVDGGDAPRQAAAAKSGDSNDESQQVEEVMQPAYVPPAEDQYVAPEEIVRKAFGPPPSASGLTQASGLWIDRQRQRVYVDGYVTMKRGSLEMFACPIGTKEHESIVATLAKASEVHAALLAIEASPGTPVQYVPEFVPATGQVIRIWVCWRDQQQEYQVADARTWVQRNGTEAEMQAEWVFAGSSFWTDPVDGREYYQADSGDMICVSNFSTALMDVTISSSAEADELQFVPYEERIPDIGTPVRLMLVPVPNPTDDPDAKPKLDANEPPTAEVLPPAQRDPLPTAKNSDQPE